jgi:hypothetical protein
MFFSDMEGNFLSDFHVGDRRPDPREGEYCSSHMGMMVTASSRICSSTPGTRAG